MYNDSTTNQMFDCHENNRPGGALVALLLVFALFLFFRERERATVKKEAD
jgi:hypothetical protein